MSERKIDGVTIRTSRGKPFWRRRKARITHVRLGGLDIQLDQYPPDTWIDIAASTGERIHFYHSPPHLYFASAGRPEITKPGWGAS